VVAEVRLEFELAHPPERVWRALTDASVLSEWFMPNDLQPTEGATFTLDPGTLPGFLGTVSGEITELVAPRRLVMLWQGEKLHTRVSWELSSEDGTCALRVVQTGFIGAPAAIRQRALRATYGQLFEQRLPAALDRLATGALDWGGQPAETPADQAEPAAPAVRVAAPGVPKQRHAIGNVPLAAWSAGRRMAVGGGEPAPDPEAGSPAATAPEPEPVPAPAREGTRPPGRPGRPAESGSPWRRRLTGLPAWVRAVTVAGSAAVLVLLVLAVAVWTSGPGPGFGGGSDGEERDRGPGAALQPGAVGASEEAPGGSGGASAGPAPGASAGPGSGEAGAPGQQPGAVPGGAPSGGSPEVTPLPEPTLPADPPELTASYTTSGGVLGVGSRSVTVTVSNPGPGGATGWEVAMDVGDQDVSNVSGANHRQDGSLAIFTAPAPGPAAGQRATFSYEVGGLLGADDPSSCTIDGRPCD
jgi:uncharacterized protein YndB with AHSA1/START domain